MTKNILAEIYQHKLIEVREAKKHKRLEDICKEIKCAQNKPKDFVQALRNKISQNKPALICEIKKASPSKGMIRENFNAIEIAQAYEQAGAACLSILTDKKYFLGSNEYLAQGRANSSLPILRKDFMVDCYQIYEAKLLGADCILLIVAMLDDEKLRELEQCAIDIGLSVLIEVHNEEEMQRALQMKSKLIGINNRDLKTLQVDLQNSLRLAPLVPKDCVLVGESGIKTKQDIAMLQNAGINCFLIGEHFMSQDDVGVAVAQLLS